MSAATRRNSSPDTAQRGRSRCFATASTSSPIAKSGRSSARWTSRRKSRAQLIDKLFDLGVMGIEVPEAYGGAGATFFHSVLAVEALSRVDPSVGVLVDVQNTLVINALLRWGDEEQKAAYLPRLAAGTVGAYALSEAGSGSDAFALATRAAETRRRTSSSTAASSGSPTPTRPDLFIVFANVDPEAGYRGITAFLVERGFPGSPSARRKTSSASARAARASCCSRTAACRAPTCSARSARATRWRSRR